MIDPSRPRIQDYPTWDRSTLIARLADLLAELTSTTDDYWRMKADEVRAKSESWLSSTEETVKGRERDVELATFNTTASVFETRGAVESLTQERDFILFLLKEVSNGKTTV